ncbi:type IV secretion system protein VirB9 [Dyella sp. OK004]|uniref:TrbG/VirB9 family P-type conjugative transfer protein n=1 Tax=Dyella sp. OK004 TaxID=1855292 RepID=UPI0008E46753|nr:TrbG/VirB9 family P-type conjugative transfer protein [Dyella sp. OK004]SFR90056.1 type IV secretion system protein VirB9 [Dyella sp. OK004]
MNRTSQLALSVALCIAAAAAPRGASAQAVQQYEYQPDRVYQVRTGLGITTQIELSPNEKILDFSTGFSSGWELSRRDNVFYVKPKNVDVDTNLMIRTATHSYIFELKVVATDWRTLDQARIKGVQYKIAFNYPADTAFANEATKVADAPELSTALVKGRNYNFSYDYAMRSRTPPWLVPVNVYDDGQFTYIKLSDMTKFPTGDFPAVYMREKEHGEDSVINTTVEGNTIIVHGTYPYLVIRHGDNVVGLRRNVAK